MKTSAGLIMYQLKNQTPFVLLVHHGGPFFKNKNLGSWTIPGGAPQDDGGFLNTAKREFEEETGIKPEGEFVELGSVKYSSGKVVHAWAFQNENTPAEFKSNSFQMEWPPRSGRQQSFPEIDDWQFFDLETAKNKIIPTQLPLIERLERILSQN